MGLSLQELLDWPAEIGNLASATHAAAATHTRSGEFYRSLASASTWEGAAGATAQQAMVASAGDHEDAAERLGKAATAMDNAENDSESLADDVKAILNDAAAAPAVQVNTTTNQVIPPDTSYLTDEAAAAVAAKVADLRTRIAAALARGVTTDSQLAQAISSATGVPAAKAPQPAASPPAQPAPPQPKTLDEAMSQLAGRSGPLPPPKLRPPMDPAEAERAKALLRQVMANDGVPPDQIEARVNELMAKARQPLPPSAKPSDPKGPEPGFGDGFADTWFGTEQQIRNLLGQGGPGEPGVAESWGDLLKGTAEQFSGPFGPLNPAVNEVKNALNSPNPAYYLGQKTAEGAMTAPTVMFGGEGALARAGLGLPDAVPEELVSGATHGTSASEVPLPTHGPTFADHMPFEIGDPIDASRPEFTLSNPLEYMPPGLQQQAEQYLTNSGETVLGPYNPKGGGPSYIEVAQQRGASYFDLGQDWYSYTATQQMAANQHVLDMTIANGDTVKLSVPVTEIPQDTFTGAELRYLQEHGYVLIDERTLVPPGYGG